MIIYKAKKKHGKKGHSIKSWISIRGFYNNNNISQKKLVEICVGWFWVFWLILGQVEVQFSKLGLTFLNSK
jgi:hypothetical protein